MLVPVQVYDELRGECDVDGVLLNKLGLASADALSRALKVARTAVS